MSAANPDPANAKVSVAMITYNQERFIAQAIESVFTQQTDFAVELVIGEDCSTDGTRKIVMDFQRRFPDQIRLLLPETNLGVNRNFIQTLVACRGQYVALLEGDDYWLSAQKLQRQCDLLDAQPECSMCAHEAYDESPDGTRLPYVRSHCVGIKSRYGLTDVLQKHFLPTASMMFRRAILADPPAALYRIPAVDWLLHVILAQSGDIAFVDEIWSVRRIHSGGLTSLAPTPAVIRHTTKSAGIIDAYLQGEYAHILRPTIRSGVIELVTDCVLCDESKVAIARKVDDSLAEYVNEYALSSEEKSQVVDGVFSNLVFLYHERHNAAALRECWLKALRPGNALLLRNLGFWSIGITAFTGVSLHAALQKIRKKASLLRA